MPYPLFLPGGNAELEDQLGEAEEVCQNGGLKTPAFYMYRRRALDGG